MELTVLRKGVEFDAIKAIESLKTMDSREFSKKANKLVADALEKFVYMTDQYDGSHPGIAVTQEDRARIAVSHERAALLETLVGKSYRESRHRGLYSHDIYEHADERRDWLATLITTLG